MNIKRIFLHHFTRRFLLGRFAQNYAARARIPPAGSQKITCFIIPVQLRLMRIQVFLRLIQRLLVS